ncbi:putative peptide-n4-asparagine amidase [Rhypophila decipiens]
MAGQITDFGSEKAHERPPQCEYQDVEDGRISFSPQSSCENENEAQASGSDRNARSTSITTWRGFLPCLTIFALTGLLIFSNRVQVKDGYLCLQRGGYQSSASVTVLEGDIVPTTLASQTGHHRDTTKAHLRFLGTQPKARIQSREPDPSPQQETATSSAPLPTRTVLQNYEVAQPVLMPYGTSDSDGSTDDDGSLSRDDCKVLLMRRDFAWSYGDPFVAKFTPPDCDFNRVVINFTVVSHGRQYDRLAIMYLGDIEVWRTSTAEPTVPPGIRWTYLKDMTQYLSLWKQPQTLIFDLGNLINDKYTGIFNTTLTATFFTSDVPTDTAPPSDLIIPISARQSSNSSVWVSQFTVPTQNATNLISDFPRNARRAVFSVSANGQASEEFWWSNVPQSDTLAFNATAGEFPGYSPFREVQVLIDGQLAGVQWPFPVIFTGGVSPGLHRPIASPDAFDLKEHEIDITPFLPLLCDGRPHIFSIIIVGLDDDGNGNARLIDPVNSSWYVTGKVFIWLDDDPDSITTGSWPTIQALPPTISVTSSVTTNETGANSSLLYSTFVHRELLISASVKTQKSSDTFSWSQRLSYSNKGRVSAFGFDQINDMTIWGDDAATGLDVMYASEYSYPLFANSSYTILPPAGNLTLFGHVRQSKHQSTKGRGNVFPTGLEAFNTRTRKFSNPVLDNTKEGEAWFFQSGDGATSSGFGDAYQTFKFSGYSDNGALGALEPDVQLYWRNISAINGSVVYDYKTIASRIDGGATVTAGKPGLVGNSDGKGMGMFAQVDEGRAKNGHFGLRAFMGRNGN